MAQTDVDGYIQSQADKGQKAYVADCLGHAVEQACRPHYECHVTQRHENDWDKIKAQPGPVLSALTMCASSVHAHNSTEVAPGVTMGASAATCKPRCQTDSIGWQIAGWSGEALCAFFCLPGGEDADPTGCGNSYAEGCWNDKCCASTVGGGADWRHIAAAGVGVGVLAGAAYLLRGDEQLGATAAGCEWSQGESCEVTFGPHQYGGPQADTAFILDIRKDVYVQDLVAAVQHDADAPLPACLALRALGGHAPVDKCMAALRRVTDLDDIAQLAAAKTACAGVILDKPAETGCVVKFEDLRLGYGLGA